MYWLSSPCVKMMMWWWQLMERRLKIIVEKHVDGYVAYPFGLKGIVVGQGDTYEQALDDVR